MSSASWLSMKNTWFEMCWRIILHEMAYAIATAMNAATTKKKSDAFILNGLVGLLDDFKIKWCFKLERIPLLYFISRYFSQMIIKFLWRIHVTIRMVIKLNSTTFLSWNWISSSDIKTVFIKFRNDVFTFHCLWKYFCSNKNWRYITKLRASSQTTFSWIPSI